MNLQKPWDSFLPVARATDRPAASKLTRYPKHEKVKMLRKSSHSRHEEASAMTFSEIENQLLNSLSSNEKGNVFEAMCCWFLENDERYRNKFDGVWIWKSELNWGQDTGIDIVARRTNGELWAIQAKAFGTRHTISKREIDSFLSASNSNHYRHRLLIATTARIGRHARTTIRHQQIEVELVLRQKLEESQLDWSPWSDKANWPERNPPPAPSNPHIEFLSEQKILRWADSHYAANNDWPNRSSGQVAGEPNLTWSKVNRALQQGNHGLPGGSSLAKFLARELGVRTPALLPPLNEEQILTWADAFYRNNGQWPTLESGLIQQSGGEIWKNIHTRLQQGGRGLPGGSSLAKLLEKSRGKRNRSSLPTLSEDQISAWAEEHWRRTGDWPTRNSGEIRVASGENWHAIDSVLKRGCRGLQGGTTLADLMMRKFGRVHYHARPHFTIDEILKWADAYNERTKVWPKEKTGQIQECPNETWDKVNRALREKGRGLPNDCPDSLGQLLDKYRQVRNLKELPRLTENIILSWADQYRRAHNGEWPTTTSGAVDNQLGEKWSNLNTALRKGGRGFPGGSSLANLLERKKGKRNPFANQKLTVGQIHRWAVAHEKRTGSWPTRRSGNVQEAPEEKWSALDVALKQGHRGLPGHSSLKSLSEM